MIFSMLTVRDDFKFREAADTETQKNETMPRTSVRATTILCSNPSIQIPLPSFQIRISMSSFCVSLNARANDRGRTCGCTAALDLSQILWCSDLHPMRSEVSFTSSVIHSLLLVSQQRPRISQGPATVFACASTPVSRCTPVPADLLNLRNPLNLLCSVGLSSYRKMSFEVASRSIISANVRTLRGGS